MPSSEITKDTKMPSCRVIWETKMPSSSHLGDQNVIQHSHPADQNASVHGFMCDEKANASRSSSRNRSARGNNQNATPCPMVVICNASSSSIMNTPWRPKCHPYSTLIAQTKRRCGKSMRTRLDPVLLAAGRDIMQVRKPQGSQPVSS